MSKKCKRFLFDKLNGFKIRKIQSSTISLYKTRTVVPIYRKKGKSTGNLFGKHGALNALTSNNYGEIYMPNFRVIKHDKNFLCVF